MRISSEPRWEDCSPVYVYITNSTTPQSEGERVLTGLKYASPAQFREVVMRALDWAEELDDDTLTDIHDALVGSDELAQMLADLSVPTTETVRETVVQVLEQSGELDEATIDDVHDVLVARLERAQNQSDDV